MGFEIILFVLYGLAAVFIFLYSLIQLQLVYFYIRKVKRSEVIDPREDVSSKVTIQLPVYNEKYVINRLLTAVAGMDYPWGNLEIQVLDDSTDETSEIVEKKVRELKSCGLDICHIKRKNRIGFKAGALAHGLQTAKGELIAIFDADFIPDRSFLKKNTGFFRDEQVGMVQTKWEHVNENYSLLTRLQAFGLDAHFTVEQGGRYEGGHFINFNGTAGIWRKKCITDSGGWQSDTLTEDLDLSYRAQLKGWKFVYNEDNASPAELPSEINSLKTQQYRWTKGAAECTRKNLGRVLKSGDFSFGTKLNAVFHLLNSSLFICIVLISVLSIPLLYIKHTNFYYADIFEAARFLIPGILFLAVFYYTSFRRKKPSTLSAFLFFLFRFPLFLSVSMGLSVHNGLAAFEGLMGKKTPFIRTPKFNILNKTDGWKKNQYMDRRVGKMTYLEIILSFYFLFGLFLCIKLNDYGLFPFLLMLTFGYAYVSVLSVKHVLNR